VKARAILALLNDARNRERKLQAMNRENRDDGDLWGVKSRNSNEMDKLQKRVIRDSVQTNGVF